MIVVESITIKEFRGIRNLTLEFKEKNFAICGPNGTGKSGVVDALEFVFTGAVSRLSGKGRGDISLKEHGPHVDRRNDIDKAYVSVKVTIPSLKKTVIIERSVKTPMTAQVTPPDAAVASILHQVQEHPEVVLSRRELIRYVLATPGERAQEIQALLRLDPLEQVRRGLQAIANSCDRQLAPLTSGAEGAREHLLRALGLSELTREKVLTATNAQRSILGLTPLTELTETASLKDGLATPTPAQPQRIAKAQALFDIKIALEKFSDLESAATKARAEEAVIEANELRGDPAINAGITRANFYTTGIELLENDVCPFCDTKWNVDELRSRVNSKLVHLENVSKRRAAAEKKIAPFIEVLRKLNASVETLISYSSRTEPPVPIEALRAYSTSCILKSRQLAAFLPLDETIAALMSIWEIPKDVLKSVDRTEALVKALPEATKQDAARDWLTVAQERLEVWREARRKQKAATEKAATTRRIYETYARTSDEVLTGLYSAVEKDFAALYRFINRDDEDNFQARLVPSMGKLGFDVDFYGRGYFPPGAYHSEGHQDGMGLCLYLALMRYLQGGNFTFAVLDDVLMSVDAGHRREVCALLKKEFPKTQFIMTTHDPIWLRHMRTEGLTTSKGGIQFRSWDVDQGPTKWDERDVWAEIDDALKTNNVRTAAGVLRHYLEYVSAELCHRLRAPVQFRGDAQYQLGELLPAAIARMRKLYGDAKRAANSWNQKEIVERLVLADSEFSRLALTSKAEDWQVNSAIHFNSWENLGRNDFEPVVVAFRDLLGGFTCIVCAEQLRVSPEREQEDALRCECGGTHFNLREKR